MKSSLHRVNYALLLRQYFSLTISYQCLCFFSIRKLFKCFFFNYIVSALCQKVQFRLILKHFYLILRVLTSKMTNPSWRIEDGGRVLIETCCLGKNCISLNNWLNNCDLIRAAMFVYSPMAFKNPASDARDSPG